MMDAADSSKTLVTMYQLIQYYIPESLNLHSYVIKIAVFGKVRPRSLVDGLLRIVIYMQIHIVMSQKIIILIFPHKIHVSQLHKRSLM
jgi:hypothetical protein